MTGPANGRAHLSIGEVLSLLQDEFPDVTISKIRFLESQGLLDPERTPSGYRKFYHADIERLRWVLRQQKEHYLPLKVIKDRLDEAGGAIPEDELTTGGAQASQAETAQGRPVQEVNGSPTPKRQAVKAREPRRRPHVNGVANGSTGNSGGGSRSTNRTNPPVTPPRRWPDSRWDEPDDPASERLSPTVLPAPPPPPAPPLSGRTGDQQRSHPPGWIDSQGVPTSGNPTNRPTASEPGGAAGRGKPQPGDQSPVAGPRAPASLPQTDDHLNPASLADVSLTVEELAEASGLSVREIRDLERYGLLEAQGEDGDGGYDGDALIMAHTAAGFLQHGIEARHMRTYKVAMEREAGLFEQIVLPVLKQRNPEARVRVARTLTELIRLGEVMRSVLLRQALRDYLKS